MRLDSYNIPNDQNEMNLYWINEGYDRRFLYFRENFNLFGKNIMIYYQKSLNLNIIYLLQIKSV